MRNQDFLTTVDQQLTMRVAGPADAPTIERLAALDSQHAPKGDVIVAEVGGELRAAVPLDGGAAIADPFRPTTDLVALLRERAAQVAGPRAERGAGFGFRLARAA
jgi:hypothetical protein